MLAELTIIAENILRLKQLHSICEKKIKIINACQQNVLPTNK